jgi:hypothetical protein
MQIRWPYLVVLVALTGLLILDFAGFDLPKNKNANNSFGRAEAFKDASSIPSKPETSNNEHLEAGFAEADISPTLGEKPVFMAGFGQDRRASKIHDPLMVRALVLHQGNQKLAIVSIDVVGFFYANVLNVREKLKDFAYVLVSSTHNHEGPDTLGLWGPNPFTSGVDADYMKNIENQIVKAVHTADAAAARVDVSIGTAQSPELLHDGREPYIKHDELVALEFRGSESPENKIRALTGIVVQWNCHPETLDSRNTEVSADFVGFAVKYLNEKYHCPVVYLTGTVGGLMTSLNVEVKDDQGTILKDGTFEKTEKYGRLVGQLADRALAWAKPIQLTPMQIHSRTVFMPMDNKYYLLGRQLGVLKRDAFTWKGDPTKAEPAATKQGKERLCLQTEIGWLQLGKLSIAAIPGEIYPELVLDKVQDPPDPGADFPNAPIEPAIYKQLPGPHRMMVGLANDEIGYIIPKRQWDEKPPFCYGRKKAQYGEVNSVGPETAPILCEAFRDLVNQRR